MILKNVAEYNLIYLSIMEDLQLKQTVISFVRKLTKLKLKPLYSYKNRVATLKSTRELYLYIL